MPLVAAFMLAAHAASAIAAGPAPVCKTEEVQGYQPKQGIVPNAKVAVAIARPIVVAAYGVESLRSWEPLTAIASGDDWEVVGRTPKEFSGGQVTIRINRCSGRVSFLHADK